MIKIPFKQSTFSIEAKERLSGINATFEFDNIQSSLVRSAKDVQKIIGPEAYSKIADSYDDENISKPIKESLDYLQRAILHFAFFKHLIFLAVRIGNDGVTTKKNNDETTAYKYQTDEIKVSLIETAWFWMDNLIDTIESASDDFPSWNASEEKKRISDVIIASSDFAFIYGIDSMYFFMKCAPLARKVVDEDITPRVKISNLAIHESDSPEVLKIKSETMLLLKKAIVYKTLSLACRIFSYYELPSPLRATIDNEYSSGSSSSGEEYIRTKVAGIIESQASEIFLKIEAAAQRLNNKVRNTSTLPYPERTYSEEDNFLMP